ncbi:MAG: protein kinase [Pirellulales bacterium]|nr:protein kinase [Pirellulales bacterium]
MSDMRCADRQRLHDYSDGKLADEESEGLAEHLNVCLTCQKELEMLDNSADPLLARFRRALAPDPYQQEPGFEQVLARARAAVQAVVSQEDMPRDNPPVPVLQLREIGDYRLLGKLGQGGMGTVYRALQVHLEKTVALKILPTERMTDSRAVARFKREMKAVGSLNHPNIVQAHDAREIQSTSILVMEYVEGCDLARLVRHNGPLRVPDACELVRQAAMGLQYVHKNKLVHRDIKPSNLMLNRAGQVKILDLGLALLQSGVSGRDMTGSEQAMGTADYIAPEQVQDAHHVDIRADIYSLGCTLYKLLAGRAPFSGKDYHSSFDKLQAHVQRPVPPIRELRPEVPPELAAILDRMVAKAAPDRYATPGEVARAITRFTSGCNLVALLRAAQAPLRPSAASESLAPATDPPAFSAMTGTQPKPCAVLAGQEGQPPHPAVSEPLAKPWKPRSRGVALATGAAGAVVLLAVVIIIKDQFGRQTVVKVPGDNVTIEVGPDGEPSKAAGTASPAAPHAPAGEGSITIAKTKPASPVVAAEPVRIAEGEPLSPSAIVARPAKIPGVRSWTIETLGHRGKVHTLAFSPDNSLLAASSVDDAVRLWDGSTGKLVRMLIGAGPAIDWSPDGKQLATSGPHGSIRIWNPRSGRLLKTLRGLLPVQSIAWSPDGKSVATASGSDPFEGFPSHRRVLVWELESGRNQEIEATVEGKSRSWLAVGGTELKWSPDGTTLAIAGANGKVFQWGRKTASILRGFPAPDQSGYSHSHVDWSPDGKLLLVAGCCDSKGNPVIYVWNSESGKLERQLEKHAFGFFSPDGSLLVARGGANTAFPLEILFDADDGSLAPARRFVTNVAHSYISYVSAVACSPDRKLGAVGWTFGDIEIQPHNDAPSRASTPPGHWQAHRDAQQHIWSPDGTRIQMPDYIDGLGLTSVVGLSSPDESRVVVNVVPGHCQRASWSPDGRLITHSTLDAPVAILQIVDARSGKRVHEIRGVRPAWCPDGQKLASLEFSGSLNGEKVWIWNAKSGEILHELRSKRIPHDTYPPGCSSLAWSPDGARLALGGDGIRIWDSASGKLLREIEEGLYREILWSPDGKTLAAIRNYRGSEPLEPGASLSEVKLFDTATGKSVDTLKTSHEGYRLLARWTPDGNLVTGGDGTFNTWDLAKREVIQTVTLPGKNSADIPMQCNLSPDLTRAAEPVSGYLRIWEIASKRILGAVVPLRDDDRLIVSADGHYHGTPKVERLLVYVVLTDSGEQLTLTPEEFAKRYGWKNDPQKVQLVPPGSPKQESRR